MKKNLFILMTIAIAIVMQSCNVPMSTDAEVSQDVAHCNVCLVIDGTDRLSKQNGVPDVSVTDLEDIARTFLTCGKGFLYVSYVDNDCDNNKVVVFSSDLQKPSSLEKKMNYQSTKEYDSIANDFQKRKKIYEANIENYLLKFTSDCSSLLELAYSDLVAKQKKGSDVTGAINQANRLLQSSQNNGERSYIVLISDGCDNVGKELRSIAPMTEILMVNTNVSKHNYQDLISREFVTLNQVSNYIFK